MGFEADDEFSMKVVDVRKEVVRLRVRGKDFSEISDELNLASAERAREIFFEHMQRSYSESSPEEMRFLQLKRLESMIDFLWDIVKVGDAASEGKQTANVIKIIEEINKLMGLHKDPLVEAQVRLTEAQISVIYETMAAMRTEMLVRALDGLRPVTNKLDAADAERVRVAIESGWATWHQEAATYALENATTKEDGQ
ncbi:hypothetical protein N2384_19935 [Bacillus paralicheniformis]|uniref:hypothetical protein n=1 Tax=Bacillus paralicheniformis TaxID=1648923 RepID=UPI0021A718D8|nr:hypothetical protein [Bacillus paralicheniformis]UWS60245.1 hypothetical protein N2384_19935 [Bacillus paralicheniformis]